MCIGSQPVFFCSSVFRWRGPCLQVVDKAQGFNPRLSPLAAAGQSMTGTKPIRILVFWGRDLK